MFLYYLYYLCEYKKIILKYFIKIILLPVGLYHISSTDTYVYMINNKTIIKNVPLISAICV